MSRFRPLGQAAEECGRRRLALDMPDAFAGIISQNGNAYVEGFGEQFWADARKYWADNSTANRELNRPYTSFADIKAQVRAVASPPRS